MPEVVLRIKVDKNAAVADMRAFRAVAVAEFKSLQDKGLTGISVAGGLAAATTTEMTKTTRAVTVSMDQQKAYQLRSRQLMLEDYKRYLTQQLTAEADYSRRAIALGDSLLQAEKRQAAEIARTRQDSIAGLSSQRRAAFAAEERQQRDERYALRSAQLDARQEDVSARRDERSGDRRTEARGQLAGNVGMGLMLTGGALLGGLAAATQQAADFDAKLIEVRNNTQMTDAEFDAMRAHILSVGGATGASMEQMSEAFMRAKNHSFDLADSLKIVDAATKSALATGSDINETANVLSQTMHIFHLSGDQATVTMNTLHQAQLQGNTTMGEFVQNFGLAEAVTSKYGLTLQDTAAITSTMTENGLNMAESGTQVRDLMQHLTNMTPKATQELDRLSKKFPELKTDIEALRAGNGNLTKTLIDLNAATGGQATEINKLIPAQRGAFGAMALSGKGATDLKKNYDQLGLTMSGKIDPATDGFLRQQKTLAAQEQRLSNDTKALGVTIGDDLTPLVREGADVLGGMARAFNELAPANQRLIVDGTILVGVLSLVAGGGLKAASSIVSMMADLKTAGIAFGGMATAAGEATAAESALATEGVTGLAAAGPWGLAIAAAVVLIGGIVVAWNEAKDAQEKYAKQKLDAKNAVNTGDTRTNISNQAAQNNADADRQQKLLNEMQATPNATMRPRDPSQGRYEDTVGVARVGGKGGMSQAAIDKLRAQQIAMLTTNIAALRHDTNSLITDGKATSDLSNERRNLMHAIGSASKTDAAIRAEMTRLQSEMSAYHLGGRHTGGSQTPDQMQARLSKLQSDLAANEAGRAANITSLHQTDKAASAEASQGYGTGEDTGMAIAQAAYAKYKSGVAASYVHLCEGLAHDNYKGIDGLYKQILEGGGAHNSAKKTLARFQAAKLARPYTPGMALPPGSLLYSNSMGSGSGHVQTIGPNGERLDQYGANHFSEKNFQYYVPPPSGKIGDTPEGGPPPASGGAGTSDKAAQDRAQALVESAGLDVDKASAAFEHCKSEYARTGDSSYLILAKTARMKLKQAQVAKASAALKKAIEEAHKDGTSALTAKAEFTSAKFSADTSYTNDITDLNDQVSGSPKDKTNTAYDVAIGRKEAQLAKLQGQIDHYSRALDKSNDPQVAAALENAYRSQKKLQDDKSGLEYKKAAFSSPLDESVLKQKEGLAVAASQAELDRNLLDLAQKRLDAFTRTLDAQKEQRQQQNRLLDAQMNAPGLADDQRGSLRGQKYQNDLADIGDQYTLDKSSLNPEVKRGATDKFHTALATLNAEYTSGTTENANEALRRHADLLRTQADATDDLSAKMRLLTEYFDTLARVAGMTPEEKAKLGIDRTTTLTSTQRDISARDGQMEIGTGLQTQNRSQIELGLSVLGMLATTGTQTQQASGRAEYLDTVKGLGTSGAIGTNEALMRIQGVRAAAQTPAEIAAATEAARQILDRLIAENGRNISLLKNPSDRRGALQAEIAKIQANPDVPAEVKHDAVTGLQGQLDNSKNRNRQTIGGDEFWKSMTEDAGREGGDIVRALLNPKDKKNIGKQFWSWLANTGENALGSVVSSSIQNALSGAMNGGGSKNGVADKISASLKNGGDKLIKSGMQFAEIVGAAMNLSGKNGKKKQKNSFFGAVLGGIAGSFMGDWAGGAEMGANIGGMFADGGRPPVGKVSVVGERGRELFVPDRPGTIIPNHHIAAYMHQAMMPTAPMSAITGMYGTAGAGVSPQGTTVGKSPGTGSVTAEFHDWGDKHYHYEADEDKSQRKMARRMEDALRGGVS